MGKRDNNLNEEKIQRWLAEGRGQGFGRDYKPWFTVRDVASTGREHRSYSHTVGRTHHLLSDLEFAHFLVLDMADDVIDIREQFPLPRDATRHIAKRLKYRHPRQPGADCDFVMTTDFVVTRVVNGVQVLDAFAVKPYAESEKKRVKQKLEIEAAYWNSLGISHSVLTEKHVSATLKKALKWLHPVRTLFAADQATQALVKASSQRLILALAAEANPRKLLAQVCTQLDEDTNVEEGSHLLAARYLLANRVLLADFEHLEIWRVAVCQTSINGRLSMEEVFGE